MTEPGQQLARRGDRPPWSWPGVVATILAAALGLGYSVTLIASAISPHPTSSEGLHLLSALGQTIAGAVSAYLGYQIGAAVPKHTEPPKGSQIEP